MNIKSMLLVLVRCISFTALILFSFQVSAVQNAASYTVATRHDLIGQVTGVISPDPDASGPLQFPAVRNTYNSQGLLEKIESGVLAAWQDDTIPPANWTAFSISTTQSYTYNDMGLKITDAKSSNGITYSLTQFSYDPYGRVECVAVRMSPRFYGSLPTTACALGTEDVYGPDRITKYTYDDHKNIHDERRAFGTSLEQVYVTYEYDGMHNKTGITDANGNYTKIKYDALGRLEYMLFPDKVSIGRENQNDYEKYAYDENGNRNYLKKRDGKEIFYTFDNLNRVTFKNLPGTTDYDVYTGYDLRGLQTYARFGSPTGKGITTTFTGFGELSSETNDLDAISYSISYKYDVNGNRIRVTYPDGQYFTNSYDGLDRLEYIKENGNENLTHLTYDNQARPESLTTAGNAVTTLLYDPISRLNAIDNQFTSTGYSFASDFSYNPAGQQVIQGVTNDIYQYKEKGSEIGSYQVNGLNQYTTAGGKTFAYDANGNFTSEGATTYSYDTENRLIGVSGTRNTVIGYDPLGRLSKVVSNNKSTYFLYSGDALLAEYQNGVMTQRYVHGVSVDRPMMSYTGSIVGGQNRQFLHVNHQGSVIAATDNDGNVSYINSYDTYGVPSSSNRGRFAYTGQIYLPDISMYYYKARIYNPRLGRFLQTDPIGYKDQMNLYAYVGNDPLNNADPSGMITGPDDAVEIVIGGSIYGLAELGLATGTCVAFCGKIITTIDNFITGLFNESSETQTVEAPKSPVIDPADVAGHTAEEIAKTAEDNGLIPQGPNPQAGQGSYTDPVTGKQRILIHPDADCGAHCHVNDADGNRLDEDGNRVPPESPEAHLPLKPSP